MSSELIFNTGNKKVDAIGRMNIRGIPYPWYKKLRNRDGYAYLPAITILYEIVGWYKPSAVRSKTGKIVGYKKRFSASCLRLNYEHLCRRYNLNKSDVINAIAYLDEKKIIKRIFNMPKKYIFNEIQIDLNVDEIQRISFSHYHYKERKKNAFDKK